MLGLICRFCSLGGVAGERLDVRENLQGCSQHYVPTSGDVSLMSTYSTVTIRGSREATDGFVLISFASAPEISVEMSMSEVLFLGGL